MLTEWLFPPSLSGLLAFGLTYLIHSTVWIVSISLLLKLPQLQAADIRNFLWKVALIGGILTSVYASFWGHRSIGIELSQRVIEVESISSSPLAAPSPESTAEVFADPPTQTAPSPHSGTQSVSSGSVILPHVQESSPGTSRESEGSSAWILWLLWAGLLTWLVGSLLLLIRHAIQHVLFFRGIQDRVIVDQPQVFLIFQQIQKKAQLNLGFQLTSSHLISSPVVIQGKEICLPSQALDSLDEQQLEGLIAHELAHVIRKDYHWSWFMLIMESLFFFQPLLRWVRREIHNSTELLCDNWAAQTTGDSFALANCLLAVAQWIQPQTPSYSLIAGMALRKSELSNRISQLINTTNMQTQHFSRLKAYITLGLALPLVMWALPGFTFLNPALAEQLPVIPQLEDLFEREAEVKESESDQVDPAPIPVPILATQEEALPLPAEEPVVLPSEEMDASFDHFMDAVRKGDLKAVKTSFHDRGYLNQRDALGRTPLIEAADGGHFLIAYWLLNQGSEVNAADHKGYTALIEAADHGHAQLANMLIDQGANLNLGSNKGYTPLMEAAFDGQYGMCSVFLQEGANPNAQTESGTTALMDAAQNGHEEVVALLLEAGATVNLKNEQGQSALSLARKHSYPDVVNLLLAHGAKRNTSLSQSTSSTQPIIRIEDRFDVNRDHPYFMIMKQIYDFSPQEQNIYFAQLHAQNSRCTAQNPGKGRLIRGQGGNNSWIFTLNYGTHVVYDTLQNCVHPGPGDRLYDAWDRQRQGKRNEYKNYSLPIGSLPSGVSNNIRSPIDDALRIKLDLKQKRQVKIYVETLDGRLYHTITDSHLKGNFSLKWDVTGVPKDTYWLHITIDGQTLSQRIGKHCSIGW